MPDSFDVFISYKREDQAFAEMLREHLMTWGYTAWMDAHNIPAGAYWPDEIDRGLNASQVVIGVLSPRAVASRNVKNEWDWSIVNGKRLLLLMIEPCVVPMNYISINYIDSVNDQAAGLARLQAALTSPTPPPSPVDPCRDYLQALYDRINTYLAQTIIKVRPDDLHTPEPIPLRSERTRGAVDALFEKRDEIDPLFMIGGIRQEPVRLDGDFRAAFEYFDGRVLLLGEPGAGKTITLLHFGRDAVVQRIQDPSKPLPVLVIIPTWDAEKQTPLAEWLVSSYGAPPDVTRIVAEGRALLLLDGLDELGGERKEPDPNDPHERIRYDPRQRFMGIIPADNQIIVTCRVQDYEEIGEKIALKGAVTLRKLADAQIRDYLSAEVPDLWAELETDEELRDVARTPLLLSLFAFGYKDQGEEAARLRDLRESPSEMREVIFRQYVQRRYDHEANKLKLRQPPETLPFTVDELYEALGHAAMESTAEWRKENVLIPGDFGLSGERLPIFTELAVRLHLLTLGEENTFRFIHLLLRDHFGFLYALPRLYDEDTAVRYHAAEALGLIGDVRAVEPLIATLRDVDDDVRHSAADALGKIGGTAVEPLLVALRDVDAEVRCRAADALGKIKDVRAVEPLIATLRDTDVGARYHAAEALGLIGNVRAVEPLIATLRDTDVGVRDTAADALGQIGDVRAVEPLIATLRDTDFGVRSTAAAALGQIGDVRAVEPLIAALHDANHWVRYLAADALGQIGDVRAIDPLFAVLRDADVEVLHHAAEALGRIGAPAVESLLTALRDKDESVRGAAAKSLGQTRDARAVEPLITALHDADAKVRHHAAGALGEIGDARAVEPLIALLSDTTKPWRFLSKRICDAAATALEQIGTPEARAAVEAWRREQNKG
jgi:HEAT repeat protein